MLRMRGEWHGLQYGTHGSYQFLSIFQLNVNRNVFLQITSPIICTTHSCKAGKRTVSYDNLVCIMKAILVFVVFQRASSEEELQ